MLSKMLDINVLKMWTIRGEPRCVWIIRFQQHNIHETSTNEIIYVFGLTKCNSVELFFSALIYIFENVKERKKIPDEKF